MNQVRIGVVGAGWMAKAHSTAFRNVPMLFGNEPAVPVLETIADIDPARAKAAAETLGFNRWTEDWRQLVADPAVDVVDIVTPNDAHAEIAIAAAKAGKHIYCEKPLALTAGEALRMTEAAEAAGVTTLVGFNYLKNPAQALAKEMIEAGELGDITQFRGTFDQDFMTDPTVPFSWRHDRSVAGSGALGDMASHTISLALELVGEMAEVCGLLATFVKQRSVATGGSGHTAKASADAAMRAVENDDLTQFLCRFNSGALGTIASSRIGTGRKLWVGYEIQGTKGALYFTQERMNELQFYRQGEPARERGYKTILTGPEHRWYAGFHPIAGIGLGYNDQKIIEARDLLVAVATGQKATPDFRFGYRVDRIVDAVLKSVDEHRWVTVDEIG
ncbi:MAG: Gfo/Idh/MocA family oxidoreductase [Inquilinus sp.]|nr:Gfo/Idh/MocA family oxidoreductase [Inquilinus sp.]